MSETDKDCKLVREYEVVYSDRLRLAEQANRLVELMVIKQTASFAGGEYSKELVDLLPSERATLDAALGYLKRQFDDGFKEAETFTKRTEMVAGNNVQN